MNCTLHSDALVLRETRKQFLMYYLFSLALVAWVVYLKLQGRAIVDVGALFAGAVAFGGILAPEAFRMWSYAVVTPENVEITSGILHRKRRRLFLPTVTDIHVRQHILQRVLNYGEVTLNATGQQHISLGTIDDPHGHVEKIDAMRMKK